MKLNTHELQAGDVVITHGMRVQLNGTPTVWWPTGPRDPQAGQTVSWTDTTVLNRDEVEAGNYVPMGFIANGWTVQGNRLARWTVERP